MVKPSKFGPGAGRLMPLMVRFGPWAMLALCLALFIVQTISLGRSIGSDTVVFYNAVQRTLTDPATLYHDERGVMGTAEALLGFLYPPPSIAMLLPFGLGTLETGHLLLSLAALACAVGAIAAWLALAERTGAVMTNGVERAALIAMAVVTGSVFTCRHGQVDTLILAIVTLGVWLIFTARTAVGAAVLAAGSWVKIYPAMLMLPLLARRDTRWPAATGFIVGAGVVMLAAFAVFPLAVWLDFAKMLPVMAERTITNVDNQSLVAIWARTVVPPEEALTTWETIVVPAGLRLAVSAAAVMTVAAFVLRAGQDRGQQLWAAAATTAMISLIAPLGWGHSYAYVLPLLALSVGDAWARRRWVSLAIAGLLWAIYVIPAHRQFAALSPDLPLWHLAYGRYAFATIGLLTLAWGQMKRREREAANVTLKSART